MDSEAFIRWALDDARTVEERYTTEILVEQGVSWWNSRHKIYIHESWEERRERQRQRLLNPAYEPRYSEDSLRKTAEVLPEFKSWSCHCGYEERPLRDLKVLAFLTNLEDLRINHVEVTDVSVLVRLPRLNILHFSSTKCDDLRPIARCAQLRELVLGWSMHGTGEHWPEVTGLEQLTQLETLSLIGNLLAFERGITWPKVRRATLKCQPVPARSVRDLPQLPACEFLTLAGVKRLDGIEAFPRLRNLKLETDVVSFAPLEGLTALTCFTCSSFEPLDIAPLTRLPKLQFAAFDARFQFNLRVIKPRDFSQFAEAPRLRELQVTNCPPVEEEVKTLNPLLLPWDDVLLAEQPRPLPPKLRMITAPANQFPQRNAVQFDPGDDGLPDDGLRACEGRWVGRFVEKLISAKLGCTDWGSATADGNYRRFSVIIESFAIVDKLPLIVEAMREALTRLRSDYEADFMISLKAPPPPPTPAQEQLEKQFRDEQEEADWERRQRDRETYLQQLHRMDVKKQLGEPVKPEDFVPPAPLPLPSPPWERDEDDEDGDDNSGIGGVKLKEKPEPPPDPWDDDHPLAENYRMMAHLTLSELWIIAYARDLAAYLMGRQPDEEIPEEKPPE
jgi:hypothetical protein